MSSIADISIIPKIETMTETSEIESMSHLNADDLPSVEISRKQLIDRINYINFQEKKTKQEAIKAFKL